MVLGNFVSILSSINFCLERSVLPGRCAVGSSRMGWGSRSEVRRVKLFARQGFRFSSLLRYPSRVVRYLQETCLEGRTFAQGPSLLQQAV